MCNYKVMISQFDGSNLVFFDKDLFFRNILKADFS